MKEEETITGCFVYVIVLGIFGFILVDTLGVKEFSFPDKKQGSVNSISNNQNECTITFKDGKTYSSREYGKGLCLLKVGDSVVLVVK